jgi:AraC family transcriptional activator of tynA and feaB
MSAALNALPMHQSANANRRAAEHFWAQLKQNRAMEASTSTVIDGYAGERLRMATFRHAPHVLTGDSIALAHRRSVLLSLQLEGHASVEQQGRRHTVAAGDFCLLDLSRSFRLETGQSTVQTIYLPMAMLREVAPQVERASSVVLSGEESAVGYLRVMYEEIFARAAELTEPVAGCLLDAIPHMLAAVLQSSALAESASPTQLRRYHKQLVRRFVLDNLSAPELCADFIGTGVGLSTSYLFELFADEPVTLMRWVAASGCCAACANSKIPRCDARASPAWPMAGASATWPISAAAFAGLLALRRGNIGRTPFSARRATNLRTFRRPRNSQVFPKF